MAKDGAATKTDLNNLERKLKIALKTDIKSLENRIVNSEVKILGELKNMREDFSTHQFSHRRINDELQDHGKRIKSLESAKI